MANRTQVTPEKERLTMDFINLKPHVEERHILKAALELGMSRNTVARRLAGKLGHYVKMDQELYGHLKDQVRKDSMAVLEATK